MDMRYVAVFTAIFLTVAGAAGAFESPFKDDSAEYLTLQKMGRHYQLMADKFGCSKFAFANLADQGKIADLAYVPYDTARTNAWTRAMTVTVYSLSGKPDVDLALMNSILNGMNAQYGKAGATIIKTESFRAGNGEPSVFIRYDIGDGDAREHNAGVFMRSSPNTAAFIQLQSRGADLPEADAQQVRKLIQPE